MIHTPRFLRDTSPFLTTALAAAASMYDPHCTVEKSHLLQEHAQDIAVEVFRRQYRSVEIVQAFAFIA